jgi:hypothetical protein
VVQRDSGLNCDCPDNEIHRFILLALLMGHNPEQVQGVGMIWLDY